jgi:hypothetical protein
MAENHHARKSKLCFFEDDSDTNYWGSCYKTSYTAEKQKAYDHSILQEKT